MRLIAFPLAASALIAALAVTGCGKESVPGGPGATTANRTGEPTHANGDAKENTFTLKVPGTSVNIDQGEDDEVTVSISRGDQFKQNVAIAITAPEGVTAMPAKVDIGLDRNDAKIRLSAAPTAPLGEAQVQVSATPETGKAVSETFKIDIKKDSDATNNRTPSTTPPNTTAPPRTP